MAAEFEGAVAKAKTLIAAPTCCYELRQKARAWLKAIGTEREYSAAVEFLDEAAADIVSIDYVIEYARLIGSKRLDAHAREVRANGGKYCDCRACALALELVALKNVILENPQLKF